MAGSLIIRGNKYSAKFRVNGVQKLVALDIDATPGNKRKAEKAMRDLIAQYEGVNLEKLKITLNDFLDLWLEEMRCLLKPSTWETYDKTINGKIKPYFAKQNKRLFDCTAQDFTNYFKFLALYGRTNGTGGLGYKSVKNIGGVLSSALDDAVTWNYISKNPVTESRMPAFETSIKSDVPQLTGEEARRLLCYAKEHESHIYIFLLLALFTGMRKGELLALTWDDIDFEHGFITVNKSRTGTRKDVTKQITTPKTESSNRRIPINSQVLSELESEKIRREIFLKNNSKFVVLTANGEPYSNLSAINRVVNRLCEKAGVPRCTIHGLRHSVATILDDEGVPLQDISVLLGHENVSTTENIYIKRRRTAKRELSDRLNDILGFVS